MSNRIHYLFIPFRQSPVAVNGRKWNFVESPMRCQSFWAIDKLKPRRKCEKESQKTITFAAMESIFAIETHAVRFFHQMQHAIRLNFELTFHCHWPSLALRHSVVNWKSHPESERKLDVQEYSPSVQKCVERIPATERKWKLNVIIIIKISNWQLKPINHAYFWSDSRTEREMPFIDAVK